VLREEETLLTLEVLDAEDTELKCEEKELPRELRDEAEETWETLLLELEIELILESDEAEELTLLSEEEMEIMLEKKLLLTELL